MAKPPAKYQIYGLQRNYIDLGTYTIKIVVSPRFKSGQEFFVTLVDSDRKPMKYEFNHWGRKLNVTFEVSKDTPDGISTGTIFRRNEPVGVFSFWVIK